MLELSKDESGLYRLFYGGDSFNVALYIARLGGTIDYFTVLGNDPHSQFMVDDWKIENIGTKLVHQIDSNSLPGIYLVDVKDDGSRKFFYWRQNSPVKKIFDYTDVDHHIAVLAAYDYFYLSGISFAILEDENKDKLLHIMSKIKQKGTKIIFDSNYRPVLWKDMSHTQNYMNKLYKLADIALPTFEDDHLIYGDTSPEKTIERIVQSGPKEIVVKNGSDGCYTLIDQKIIHYPAQPTNVVDTTAAGDSFNAGYIHARSQGMSIPECLSLASSVAALVVGFKGAIVPRSTFQNLFYGQKKSA